MPIYQYKGRSPEGKLISGKRLSSSADALGNQLISEKIIPVSIQLETEKVSFLNQIRRLWQGDKITTEELNIFSRQMHVLAKTGVPITTAIKQLAKNTRSPRMADVLQKLALSLESGQDFVSSMQAFPDVFPPLMVSMVRIGQNSGRLDEAFLRIHQYLEFSEVATKNFKTAMRYPLFVMLTILVGIIIIDLVVIPTFSQVFANANIPLPLFTTILVNISNFIINRWYFIIIILIVLIEWGRRYLKSPSGKLAWHKKQLHLPIIGKILRQITLLRFSQTFSITLKAGLTVLEGLSLAEQSIDNVYARQEIITMEDALKRGNTLTQAAGSVELFTTLELQMLAVGEETGDLAGMLEQIATFYRREIDYNVKRLSDIVQPVLIIVLSCMVLMLALAVYLPIWNMVKLVHS